MSNSSDAIDVFGMAAASAKQFFLISDGDHTNGANYAFLAKHEVVDKLAENGYKHLVIELGDSDLEKTLTKIGTGELPRGTLSDINYRIHNMSEKDSQRAVANLEKLAVYCQEEGIQIHCRNNFENASPQMIKFSKVIQSNSKFISIAGKFASKQEITEEDAAAVTKIFQENGLEHFNVFEERLRADKHLARDIKDIAGNDKVAIFYGAAHGATSKDLDEHLGKDRTSKILLTTNKNSLVVVASIATEMPATTIYTDSSRLPGHQVQVWQAKARAIGSEIPIDEFNNAEFIKLKLPIVIDGAYAPREIPVNQTEVKSR